MIDIFHPTLDDCVEWFEKMKDYHYTIEDNETLDTFTTLIMHGVVIKQDYGIYYLTNLWESVYNAYGHAFFWDRRTKGRSDFLRMALDEVMPRYALLRVTAIIPMRNRITARWLQDAGFNLEGCWRAGMLYNGILEDAYQYAYYSPKIQDKIEFTPPLFPRKANSQVQNREI